MKSIKVTTAMVCMSQQSWVSESHNNHINTGWQFRCTPLQQVMLSITDTSNVCAIIRSFLGLLVCQAIKGFGRYEIHDVFSICHHHLIFGFLLWYPKFSYSEIWAYLTQSTKSPNYILSPRKALFKCGVRAHEIWNLSKYNSLFWKYRWYFAYTIE